MSSAAAADQTRTIAIIGCGAVGRCYASALAATGHYRILLCDNAPGVPAVELAQRLDTPLHSQPGSWLSEAEVVLLCVVGSASLAVASEVVPHLLPQAIICDLSTAAAADKRTAAESAIRANLRFLDIAIMGAIAINGSRAPLLWAGTGADVVVPIMTEIGAPIRGLAGAHVGDPSTLKLLRSIFTKGVEALSVECLVAAEAFGLRQQLYETLSDLDNRKVRDTMENHARSHVIHAGRRLHEVSEAEQQVKRAGLQTQVLPGMRALFKATCAALATQPPGTTGTAEEAIAWLLASRRLDANLDVPPK